jgi:hypothetical protein
MSTTFSFAAKQINLYFATPVFIAGIVGNILNIIVFLSLRTFRQSSCAFYLMIMSICNVFNLVFGLLPISLSGLSLPDGTLASVFYCKFWAYFVVGCIQTSMTCLCLATIDQYFATCSRPRFQQLCNIKLAQRIVIITITIWMLHEIPYLVFYNHVVSPTTSRLSCADTNPVFEQYRIYFISLVLIGYLPVVIVALFGLMAYRNVQQIAYRTVPLVRRRLDKQLTVIVLVQVVINIFTTLPYTTVSAISLNKSLTADPVIQAKIQFAMMITRIFAYMTYAVSI